MIMNESYKEDMLDLLNQVPAHMLAGRTRESIEMDEDAVDRLWTLYQKSVSEYGCDPEWAFADAMHDVYGLDLHDYMMANFT